MIKKRIIGAVLALCIFLNMPGALAKEFTLPAALKIIDAEAFSDCESISGLLTVPGGTQAVGPASFVGTDVFALETMDGVSAIDADAFGGARLCYIHVKGKNTVIPAALADTAFYVFASPDSAAWTNADTSSAEFINTADIVIQSGFIFEITENGARLLCAADGDDLPETVSVPYGIGGVPVTAIAENAFWGCDGIHALNLPERFAVSGSRPNVNPDCDVDYYAPITIDTPAFDHVYTDGSSICMDWTASDDAEGYFVYRGASESGPFEPIADIANTADEENPRLFCRDENLPLGSTWYYAVQAYSDGGVNTSAMSDVRKAVVSNTILGKPRMDFYYEQHRLSGITVVMNIARSDGDGIYRTDIYRSADPFGEFELAGTLNGSDNCFTDVQHPYGSVIYYRLQTFAVIDGVEWASDLSDIITIELSGDDLAFDTSLIAKLFYEGPGFGIRTTNGKVFDIYRSETIDGLYQKIDTVTITTGYDDNIYSSCGYLLPESALETGAYYKAHERLEGGTFGRRSEAVYVPSAEECRITLVPDRAECETGTEITWRYTVPDLSGIYIQNRASVYANGAVSATVTSGDGVFSYSTPVDGEYCLKVQFRLSDVSGNSVNTEIESAVSVISTTSRGSSHPYVLGDGGYHWYAGDPDSGYQLVTFSDLCNLVQRPYSGQTDSITVYDEWGGKIGTYTGTELAGKTISVPGTGVGIDFSAGYYANNTAFGYAITDMVGMPHLELKIKEISVSSDTSDTGSGITWTACVQDGCDPFTVRWDIYRDGTIFESITQRGLSVTYYPPCEGEYHVRAVVSDNLYSAEMTGGSCSVAGKYAPESDFTYTIDYNTVTITGYTGSEGSVRIPETISGLPVTAIGNAAFRDSEVSAWTLPDSILKIGNSAFDGAALSMIRLPENPSLTLGNACFIDTANLTRITLPAALSAIPQECFAYSGLERILIPSTITQLGHSAFFHCESLTEVTFVENGLKTIPASCFEDCSSLERIVLPKTVTTIEQGAFFGIGTHLIAGGVRHPFEIWMGRSVSSIPDCYNYGSLAFSQVVVYAPADSYAAGWANTYADDPYSFTTVRYGGSGCDELFGGDHDYTAISDILSMDAETGLHMHDVVYECGRCAVQKSETQAKTAMGCWRCEVKAACGEGASIPQNKFEFLNRYKLGGNVYYRIRLIVDHNGVNAGHEALFMDSQLQMVVDRETIATLFRTYMYTGDGILPWEYTETESDYPSLEKRGELIASSLANAERSVSLASNFMKLDVVMEKLGATASAGLSLLWGNPEGALKSLKGAAVPDTDLLLTVMHLTILNKLGESTRYDAQHYADSLETIVDNEGFISCEAAEASLETYANALALWQLCIDNSSGIINEIAACGTDVGVGVRNIMTMLKGAVGVTDNPYAKTGVLVTSTMYSAITQADDIGEVCTGLIIKYIGDLAKIIGDVTKSSCLGAFITIYKADAFALSEFLYVDGAMDKYEKSYNAFCLKSDTPLYGAHEALAA